ncbi:hypothetical protein JIN84_01955 [Luteolibacter yonseiensis]|uniref:Uncharacterized protein n=1 Tax=Luteolibacter yonseiensis TaxID=1144680 RepID=A0A934V5V7_9BACT|nr:hypothetical protein [Luteolibacter yonseiensis]MBK1814357.1 hypothetical protein [Luteolibacter yonseiensis]
MNFRLTTALAALLCVSLAACYPYDESRDRRRVQKKPENASVTSVEQQKLQAQRDELKKKEEAAKKEELKETTVAPDTSVPPTEAPKPPVEEKKPDIPVANKVPGKDGYVFSPFNNKLIDVRGYAPGTLVADPTYPESAKKHFRVP